jgi:hypothetical protein
MASLGDPPATTTVSGVSAPRSRIWTCLDQSNGLDSGDASLEVSGRMAIAGPRMGPIGVDNSALHEVGLGLSVLWAGFLFAWICILGRLR